MGSQNQNRVRMTAERHWERFDESSHDNANQMRQCAEDAIQELLTRDCENPSLKPHLYRELVNELTEVARKYATTQQLRARVGRVVGKYLETPSV